MKSRFSHVNVVSRDWRTLADFYINVFGCREKPPVRDLQGGWVDDLTGLSDAHIKGMHLLLPGMGDDGPTLEIFQYHENRRNDDKGINVEGFGHIAFAVEDMEESIQALLAHGGSLVGKSIDATIEGAGRISVVYARDPEGNILELQKWT